jgi:hypothetical protein
MKAGWGHRSVKVAKVTKMGAKESPMIESVHESVIGQNGAL